MKIVHVIPALTKGGAERVAVELANYAASAGHDVTILAAVPAPPELLANRVDSNVRLRFLLPQGRKVRVAYARIPLWILRNRTWLLDQDVIHCHLTLGAAFGAAVQAMRALCGARMPAVVETYHGVGMAVPSPNRAMHALLLKSRDAVALMAEDTYWRRFAESDRRQAVTLIPNGISRPPAIDLSASNELRKRLGLPDQAVIIGSIGRLVTDRRPDILLEIFACLAKRTNRDVHLLLAGDGPARRRLAGYAARLGLSGRVHLPGLVHNPSEPLALINLYLTVNVGGTTGIAALEAAYAGIPIIAFQLDQDYQPKRKDWIWSSRDPTAVAHHAADLLDSPEALSELAQKQQAHVRAHHAVQTMALAYQRLYDEAVARCGRVEQGSGSASRQR